MTDRTPLDDLTSDALDTLYDRLDAYERWATAAEAAVARARELHREAYPDHPGQSCTAGCGTWPCPTTRALGIAPDPGTVTITQARHTALTAGQCTHYLDTHQQHHTEPVTGCPYPGCHPDA